MHRYSGFWLAVARGGVDLAIFAVNDTPEEPALVEDAEALTIEAWLRLLERDRAAVVEAYAARRPAWRSDGERRRKETIAYE